MTVTGANLQNSANIAKRLPPRKKPEPRERRAFFNSQINVTPSRMSSTSRASTRSPVLTDSTLEFRVRNASPVWSSSDLAKDSSKQEYTNKILPISRETPQVCWRGHTSRKKFVVAAHSALLSTRGSKEKAPS